MVMLPNSQSSVDDKEMRKIEETLKKFLPNDVIITIHHTPLNIECKYTTALTILRDSLEKAEPICDAIVQELRSIGETPYKCQTTLLYGSNIQKVFIEA